MCFFFYFCQESHLVSVQNISSSALKHSALRIGRKERWCQADGGMQSGVFANLTAHLTALYNGWILVSQHRTGQSWFSMVRRLLEFPLAAANPLPPFISLFFSLKRLCPVSFPHRLTLSSACFLTIWATLSPQFLHFSIFNTQHTLLSRLKKILCKSAGRPNSLQY